MKVYLSNTLCYSFPVICHIYILTPNMDGYKIAPIFAGELNTKVQNKIKFLSCTKIKIGQVKRMGTKLETDPLPVE